MEKWIDILEFVLYNFIFVLTVIIFSAYVILAVFSAVMLTRYLRKNSYVDYNSIILAPLIPTISVIAPAYNESKSIVANIRALLSLYYNDFEVIVVNDGSKDDTLKKIIEAYDLERVNYFFDYRIPCKGSGGVQIQEPFVQETDGH